jgi:uncharacterized protein (TIGR02001 family)
MKIKSLTILCAALAATGVFAQTAAPAAPAAPAAAPEPTSTLSFNVGVVSDYRFRGIAQTSFKPALQFGVDYAHTSGLYVGAWSSNINWIKDYVGATDGTQEVDLYGGYKGEIAKDFTFDVGVITYQYPGNTADRVLVNANTTEVYGALTYGIVTGKYSQSTGNFIANPNSQGSAYFELAAAFDLGNGWSLTPHAGHQSIPNQANNAGDYTDFALTLGKDFGNGLSASLAAMTTNAQDSFYKVPGFDNLGKNVVQVGLKYTF